MIQSAISRQREFLADASAVQFTRNPDGIGSALEKIGGFSSQLEEPAVIEQIEQMRSAVDIIPSHQRLTSLDRQVTKIRDTVHTSRLLKCAYGMVDILPPENWQTTLVYLVLNHRLAPTTGTAPAIYHSIADVWVETLNILATLARLTSSTQEIEYSFEASLMRLPSNQSSQSKLPPEITWREF